MMNNKIDTLVVTATLGDRDTLEKTIQSVRTIGGNRVRHIIITSENKKEFLENKYKNIEVITEPAECKGIYSALNYVFRQYYKKYKFMTFINDDDFWLPDFLELFKIMDSHDNIDAVYGKTLFINEEGEKIGEQTSSARYKSFLTLFNEGIILFTQQATLIRTDLFEKVGGFDENYKLIADTKFWIEAINSKANFFYVNKICSAYRLQEGQLSSNKNLQSLEHENLLKEFQIKENLLKRKFEKLYFRIGNFPIYLRRLKKYNYP